METSINNREFDTKLPAFLQAPGNMLAKTGFLSLICMEKQRTTAALSAVFVARCLPDVPVNTKPNRYRIIFYLTLIAQNMSQAKKKFYTVWQGRQRGVYTSWQDCLEQVQGFKDARYKSFETQHEAEEALKTGFATYIQFNAKTKPTETKTPQKQSALATPKPIVPSLSVDAACSGNPGKLEYQGVDTLTRKHIFHQGPFEGGTNNIGEFLALVHALAYLKKINSPLPVYTDSRTARAWVKQKKVKTTLARTAKTDKLFDLIDRALVWLHTNTYTTQILTWETELWGENPADFGRK